MNNLLVVGSVAYDSIKTPFFKVSKVLGGSASYFSLASRLFAKTSLIGVVGTDFKHKRVLNKKNIVLSGLVVNKGKTFHWSGQYGFDINTRTSLKTELGVFANFTPVLSEEQKQSEAVFLGNIHPSLQLSVLEQLHSPKFVGLDTMNFWIKSARPKLLKVLPKIDLLIINDSEARQLSGEANLLKAAKKILGLMTPLNPPLPRRGKYLYNLPTHRPNSRGGLDSDDNSEKTLIIKQGEYGLLMFQSNQSLRGAQRATKQSAPKTFNLPGFLLENPIDPTGAGDSFAGGTMGFLAKSGDFSWKNLKTACLWGSCAASLCVEGVGTKNLEKLTLAVLKKRNKEYGELLGNMGK